MTDLAELEHHPRVQRWFQAARYDQDPAEERQRRLALLAEFMEHVGRDPDDLVTHLHRTTKQGHAAFSFKKRDALNVAIDEFVEKRGLAGKDAVVTGNMLRGYFVHNGIFFPSKAWMG